MKDTNVIGLDIAKHTFHLVMLNRYGKKVGKKTLKRSQVLEYFSNVQACIIGIEGCATAHYWARHFISLGHQVKLLPAQYVKAYVRGNKNDYNDALAIAEASRVHEMRTIAVKTEEQQGLQALHRMRKATVADRTALCNQVRGLLAEFGIIENRGIATLRRALPYLLEDAENNLPHTFREALALKYQQLLQLDEMVDELTKQLQQASKIYAEVQRLQTIPGFGFIVASAFFSHFGNGKQFKRGRDISAALGIVPRQHSSGGKAQLLGISKRGDKYLRSLLIHGARSVLLYSHKKEDALSQWINRLVERRGKNKATVALANKLARIAWAVLTKKQSYQAEYAC